MRPIIDSFGRFVLICILLLTLSGCRDSAQKDGQQSRSIFELPPPPYPCSVFDELHWQEFRFGLDSPVDVAATVARSRVKKREQVHTTQLGRSWVVLWKEYNHELYVSYQASFDYEGGLLRIRGKLDPQPTLAQVLVCLGSPDYYKAIYSAFYEVFFLTLTLYYPGRGIIVQHVSGSKQRQVPRPAIEAYFWMEAFYAVAPGGHEELVATVNRLGDDVDELAHESCILKPWPGRIEALEVQSFIYVNPLCSFHAAS